MNQVDFLAGWLLYWLMVKFIDIKKKMSLEDLASASLIAAIMKDDGIDAVEKEFRKCKNISDEVIQAAKKSALSRSRAIS